MSFTWIQRPLVVAAVGAAALLLPAPALAQTAEELMAWHVEAIGGRAALERLQDRVETWSLTLETLETKMEGTATVKVLQPDRYQVSVSLDREGAPLKMIVSYDGKTGWRENGGQVTRLQGEELTELRNRARRMNLGHFLHLDALGGKAVFKGKRSVAGRPTNVLEVTPQEGEKTTYYLDEKTHLIVKTEGTTAQQGVVVDVESWPTSYRSIQGVRIPDKVEVLRTVAESDRELLYKLELKDVKVNTGLQDSAFAPTSGGDPGPPARKQKKRGWY